MTKLRAFTMPKWGIEMTEGVIAEWTIMPGTNFTKGEIITLIETDKIANEVEAEYDAVACRLIAEPGKTYPVGALLAVFGDSAAPESEIDQFIAGFGGPAGAASTPSATPAPPPSATQAPRAPVPTDSRIISPAAAANASASGIDVSNVQGSGRVGRITLQDVEQAAKPERPFPAGEPVSIEPDASFESFFASPLAKRLAATHKVDLGGVTGTGPRGRISKADVLNMVSATQPPPAVVAPTMPPPRPASGMEVIHMSPMRKAIARQLSLSKSTIPHFYLRNSARVDALMALREQARRATGQAPSVNDYLVRACAIALQRHPDINVQVHGEDIHRFPNADISIAVATDKGLITPIVRDAETKSVAEISAEVKRLAERARAGRLAPEEFQGGSFSISNLGMFGIDTFDAIINPPQGAILAIGAARQSAGAADHALVFATRIQLSLSCDHRAIDGAVGARFLAELTSLIEAPEELTR